MPATATREILEVDVEEVSLVDAAANLREFLILKSMENKQMSSKATSKDGTEVETVEVEQTNPASGETVQKALEAVESIVARVVKALAPTVPIEAPSTPVVETAAPTPAIVPAVVENLEKSKTPLEEGALTLGILVDSLTKAKTFTPKRIQQLKDAHDVLKLVLEGVEPGTLPGTNTPSLEAPSLPSGITELTKQATSESNTALLKSLLESVDTLNKRMEAFEKAKPAPSAPPSNGTVVTTQTTKSIWSGVL